MKQKKWPHPKDHLLIVVVGPTAVGKTAFSIGLAKALQTEIISADSRQIYKGMPIATAQVSSDEMDGVPHHLIGHIEATESYSAGRYEKESLQALDRIFRKKKTVILTGGTGLYVQAVCDGLDEFIPTPNHIREDIQRTLDTEGLPTLLAELDQKDPIYGQQVDRKNPRRVQRALEFIRTSGQPFSSFRKNRKIDRPFTIKKILLERDRQELYERINLRVLHMVKNGLVEEAKKWHRAASTVAAQTVGYRELFEYFDGHIPLERAIELIQQNTRRYAKRQLTWFRKNEYDAILHPSEIEKGVALAQDWSMKNDSQ